MERPLGALFERLKFLSAQARAGNRLMSTASSVTPATERMTPNLWRSQVARGESSPRRYVGRSATVGAPASPQNARQPVGSSARQHAGEKATHRRARTEPWSVRLFVAIGLVCLLLAGLRVPGVTTAPLDPSAGSEATHAAFAQVLAGAVGGALEPVKYFPSPPPWHGLAPANPSAGLPVYGWLTGLALEITGGIWSGRVISILLSTFAGLLLFWLVRRTAGARAGLYALLFFAISPAAIILGQQFSPVGLSLAAQAPCILTLFHWRHTSTRRGIAGGAVGFAAACVAGVFAALVDPGNVFLLIPGAYLVLSAGHGDGNNIDLRSTLWHRGELANGWRQTWANSPYRGKAVGYAACLLGAALIWKLVSSGTADALVLSPVDGGGGVGDVVASLLQGGTYVQIIGLLMEKLLTILGALLLFSGLIHGARRPFSLLYHAWIAAALLQVLGDAPRVGHHDEVLLPLLLPTCALVGIGAAWAGALPARIWLAITEQRHEGQVQYNVSPHTAWLLDLPEEVSDAVKQSRPQAQIALGKSIAARTQAAGYRARRAFVMVIGNIAVLGALGVMVYAGWGSVQARLQPTVAAIEIKQAGDDIRAATTEGSRLIVVGPGFAEILFAAGRSGWALSTDEFSMAEAQRLQKQGAGYLLSTDQEWLGHHPDYVGLLTSYSVAKLGRNYILFDLNTRPAANDRLYFLESGHTLGGEFKRFWQQNGGVARLGYPVSEELEETNPLDGAKRRTQYFERAILEYHADKAGTPDQVMLASVGLWLTHGRTFPTVAPFKSTPDRAYFEQTGHSVKEAFLRYWQSQGGVQAFGYPISEELPEISSADGKVYTVQYFERARLEWHPTAAGTKDEVQLGLLGKQAWLSRK